MRNGSKTESDLTLPARVGSGKEKLDEEKLHRTHIPYLQNLTVGGVAM